MDQPSTGSQFLPDFNHQQYVPSHFSNVVSDTPLEHTPSNHLGIPFIVRDAGGLLGVCDIGVCCNFLGLKYQLNVGLSIPFVPWMRAALRDDKL